MSLFAPIRSALLPTTLALGLNACSGDDFVATASTPDGGMAGGAGLAGEGGSGGLAGSAGRGGEAGIGGSAGVAGMAGQGGIAGSAGMMGVLDGGVDGSTVNLPDPNDHPTILRPTDGTTMSPVRAFFLWEPGPMQDAADIVGWRVCYTKNDADPITAHADCPNGMTEANPYFVLDNLTADSNYAFKVAAVMADGGLSAYELMTFDTDASTIAIYKGGPNIGNGDPYPDTSLDANGNFNGNDGVLVSNNQNIEIADADAIDGLTNEFDGANDYVDLIPAQNALSFDGSGTISVESRFRVDQLPANFASYRIFALNGQNGTGRRFDLAYVNINGIPNLRAVIAGEAQDTSVQTLSITYELPSSTIGQYVHSVVTYLGAPISTLSLYVNGEAVGSEVAPSASESFAFAAGDIQFMALGAFIDTVSLPDFFHGRLDEVIFDDKSLSPDAVRNRFCAGSALLPAGGLPINCAQ